MDERLRFVARLLEGEKIATLCRSSISRAKTGYKIFERYKDYGVHGLTDRSRRSYRHANQLPAQVERLIVRIRREHPTWGAPKVREKLRRGETDIQIPAISTVHAVLDRHGLVSRGRTRQPHLPDLFADLRGFGELQAAWCARPCRRRICARVLPWFNSQTLCRSLGCGVSCCRALTTMTRDGKTADLHPAPNLVD